MEKLIVISVALSLSSIGFADEAANNSYFKGLCDLNKSYMTSGYEVECNETYQHYNIPNKKTWKYRLGKRAGEAKIMNFNIWHPGKSNTQFKDYSLVAKLMSEYHIISALELVPAVGEDKDINERLAKLINNLSGEMREKKSILEGPGKRSQKTLKKIADEVNELGEKLDLAKKSFNKPGYLIILEELRKINPNWSLILTPRAQAAKETDVKEHVGFYYNAELVKPIKNFYCEDLVGKGKIFNKNGIPACIPSFNHDIMGEKDYRIAFSRRPFMGSFQMGNFDFTLLASHVVFNSPTDVETKKRIMKLAFNTEETNFKTLGNGISSENYARLAEVKLTVDFMKRMSESYRAHKDIIFAGDFNLESTNEILQGIITASPDLALTITEKTSVSESKLVENKNPTAGYASNYDHFILNTNDSHECDLSSARRTDFINGNFAEAINDKYRVRSEYQIANTIYEVDSNSSSVIENSISSLINRLKSNNVRVVRNDLVERYSEEEIETIKSKLKTRVFQSQFFDDTFYRVYKEVISDHAPIEINCRTNSRNDDLHRR